MATLDWLYKTMKQHQILIYQIDKITLEGGIKKKNLKFSLFKKKKKATSGSGTRL